MSGIDRNPNRGAVKALGEQDAGRRVFVLDVFDDEFAADVFGTLHNILERQMDPFGECLPGSPGLISRLL